MFSKGSFMVYFSEREMSSVHIYRHAFVVDVKDVKRLNVMDSSTTIRKLPRN